jgi:hypothetical protein
LLKFIGGVFVAHPTNTHHHTRPHDTVTIPEVAYAVNLIDLLMMDTERVRNMYRKVTKQKIKYCDVTSCWYFLIKTLTGVSKAKMSS